MLEDQAMAEMLENQLSLSSLTYFPRDLPNHINKLLDTDFPLLGWNLLYKKQDYTSTEEGIQFERKFHGKFEFKLFYSLEDVKHTYVHLENNGRSYRLLAQSSRESGFNRVKKSTLTFIYDQKPLLEKGWKIKFINRSFNSKSESIYYRILT